MIDKDSTSGFFSGDFEGVSQEFTEVTELRRTSHNILLKGKRRGRWWLLKGLLPEEADQPAFQEMLRKECELLLRAQVPGHPSVVKTTGMETIGGALFIVMEYVEGETLKDYLAKNPSDSAKMRITRELIDAVSYLHHLDIVHRDLKPSNIMVTRGGRNVKVIDFGLADADFFAILKQPSGTDGYMSPEQAEGSLPDVRNDIFSLGKILEDMWILSPLTPSKEGEKVNGKSLNGKWEKVVKRCLQPIDRRYHNIEELQDDLRRIERNKRMKIAACLLLVCLCAGAFWYWQTHKPKPQIFQDMTAWTYTEPQCFQVTNEGTKNTIVFCGIDGQEPVHCPIYVRAGHRYRISVDYSTDGYEPVRFGDAFFQIFVREGVPRRTMNNSGCASSAEMPSEPVKDHRLTVDFTATNDLMYVRMNFNHVRDSIDFVFHFDNWKLEELPAIEGDRIDEHGTLFFYNEAAGLLLGRGGLWDAQAAVKPKGLPLDLTRYGNGYVIDTHEFDPGDGVDERYLYWYEGAELGTVWIDGNAQVWYFFRQADGCYKLMNDTGLFLTCEQGDSLLTMQPDADDSSRGHWKLIKANVKEVSNEPRDYY